MDYPIEWNELPRSERRKKIRQLKKEKKIIVQNVNVFKKIVSSFVGIILIIGLVYGFKILTKKSPEQVAYEEEVKQISLEGKVEEFDLEGRGHIPASTNVSYQTNPPTSGDHISSAKNWGIYKKEIDDKFAVHNLEHGGIWISYKEIDEASIEILKEIGKENLQSVVVSPRQGNNDKIVIASWGKYMKLETVDKALIQKYIDTYKNQSPEKLAL